MSQPESFVCIHCNRYRPTNKRLKGKQSYCGEPDCQRARKAAWKRRKMTIDSDYRKTQESSNRHWLGKHTEYWQEYRKSNPEKAERNRILQRKRNLRRIEKKNEYRDEIAKVDALNKLKHHLIRGIDVFWLVPEIAKVDALKIKIAIISEGY